MITAQPPMAYGSTWIGRDLLDMLKPCAMELFQAPDGPEDSDRYLWPQFGSLPKRAVFKPQGHPSAKGRG